MKKLKVFMPCVVVLLLLIGSVGYLVSQKPDGGEEYNVVKEWLQTGRDEEGFVQIDDEVENLTEDLESGQQNVANEEGEGYNQETDAIDNPVQSSDSMASSQGDADTWKKDTPYGSGDQVVWQGDVYRSKWWNSNEQPDKRSTQGAWECIGPYEVAEEKQSDSNEHESTEPVEEPDTSPKPTHFKIVGYYPEWKPEAVGQIRYDQLTHINYAFAIPTTEGTLRPLEQPELAKEIIKKGHGKGVKVLLAVGGWEYQGTPLEATFVEATNSPEKIKKLGDSILEMVEAYGFDGVDMDWEHPRTDGPSKDQYASLMQYLSQALHAKGKLLSAAVVAGVTPDGNVLWDAAGHTDVALSTVDYINVMAYDGGDGDRHSSYEFAVASATYWHKTRGLAKEKVILGVPFYGRPGWLTYKEILDVDQGADGKDIVNNMYYNGLATIEKKTRWALENVGGVMIWEITQDSAQKDKSLLNKIYTTVTK